MMIMTMVRMRRIMRRMMMMRSGRKLMIMTMVMMRIRMLMEPVGLTWCVVLVVDRMSRCQTPIR